jgi:hypothetical protein
MNSKLIMIKVKDKNVLRSNKKREIIFGCMAIVEEE